MNRAREQIMSDTTASAVDNRDAWTAPFDAFIAGRNEPEWLTERRRQAIDRFSALGFPSKRHEQWKYTDTSRIAKSAFSTGRRETVDQVTADALERYTFWDSSAARLTFVNGLHAEHLGHHHDLPDGIRVASLADVLRDDPDSLEEHLGLVAPFESHAFRALNFAFFTEGVVIDVPDGLQLERPIHILSIQAPCVSPVVSHPRILIHVGRGASATIVEQYGALGGHECFVNPVTEIVLAENAEVAHDLIQRENDGTSHIGTVRAIQGRDSRFRSCVVTVAGHLVRNDTEAVHGGENCETHLDGLYLTRGDQHVDNHTVVDHAFPHCRSFELYKGILTDSSTGVFNGKIVVREGATQTDAHQNNMNLLLSDKADIDTKPELEIYHNDVKCSHGATIGQLDDDALFYLRSRGIPEDQARSLLTYAFASDVVDRVRIEPIRQRLKEFLARRMTWASTAEDAS